MNSSRLNTNATAAQGSAEAELRRLITKYASPYQHLVETTRRWLQERLPTAQEIVYEYSGFFVISFSPNERGYDGVFAIRADANSVRFYLNRGKGLPDPAKMLRGTASQVRYVEIENPSTLARPELACLVDEAIARNPVPFAATGGGQIIIQSSSKKKSTKHSP